MGIQARDIGNINIEALKEDIGTFNVTRSTGDIRISDRILPTEERVIEPTFFPSAPEDEVEGLIISIEQEGVNQVGLLDVVAINLGEEDNLIAGNVLSIFKRGIVTVDRTKKGKAETITLPDERAGILMVFKSFDKMSLALVLKADRGIRVGDYVRMP